MAEKENNFAMIALVAIVAVVGLISLVMMQGGANKVAAASAPVPVDSASGNTIGEAVHVVWVVTCPDGSEASGTTWKEAKNNCPTQQYE